MRVLSISHQRDAGPGVFTDAFAERGHELEHWFIAETDEPPGDPRRYDAVMSFGGSAHPDQDDRHGWMAPEKDLLRELLAQETPLLTVCLGSQLLAEAAGGEAMRASDPEIGWFQIEVADEGRSDPLLGPLAPSFEAFEWHSYRVALPTEATILAQTPVCVQAFRIGNAWGIQFHAEVTEADALRWIDEYYTDEDAVRIGVDPEALRAETEAKMPGFNQLGRELCGRWLDAVAS